MARIKGALMTRKRRKKTLKMAKGYWGRKSTNYRIANQAVMKSLTYAYTGRKLKKRDFRRLWITRISAGCKSNGMNYSTFINGLKKALGKYILFLDQDDEISDFFIIFFLFFLTN